MKRVTIFFLFFLLPVVCLAEEKVYTNTDLKSESPINNKSTLPPSPQQQRQDISSNKGRIISRGFFEQRDPAFQPQNETKPQPPQSPDIARPGADVNQTQPKAFKPVNPFPVPPQGAMERLLAEACARVTVLMLIVVGIPFLIWLICLIDVLRNEFTGNNKIIWFLVVFFLPVLGSILYFFIGTDHKIRPEDDEEPVTRLI